MEYVNRILESKILNYINDKEIIAVIGPRQSGKTTLIKHILSNIKNKKIKQISFDNIFELELFENDIEGFIDLNVKNNDILFIDEIQYSKQSGKKLKYIYDNNDIKIFISGSSSIDISVESLKYLVGRIFVFTLYPFNFYEFLLAKDENLAEIFKKGKFGEILHKKLLKYQDEFIKFGGFPRVILENNIEKKKTILQNIFQTYIMKEIKEIFSVRNDFKIFNLMKILSFQEGNLISYEELATHTEINRNVLKEYLNILEKAFIIKLLHPFYTNKRLEIIKSPKLYFIDSGLRNIINGFNATGSIYESLIFTELLKKGIELKYWRTKSKAEVDFVYEKKDELIPIEVKSKLTKPKITKSFYSFVKKYSPKVGYILSRDFEKLHNVDTCNIIFSTFVKFFNEIE
jgi:predicted AAA+ superfamily ATPase